MPTQKSNNEPGDLRWKLIDSIIRRLAYLVAQVGISPERFIERVCHVVDGMKPPTPAGHTPSESRTFAEAHSGPEIMHVWFGELDFLDSSGQPKRLPLAGGRQSFEDLVRRSVPGVKPANALSDLLAARAVQLTEDGCVVPVKASLVVSDTHRGAEMGLYSVANLLDSIQSNVGAAPTNRTFQREAVCLRFDRSHMPRVHRHLGQQCAANLEVADAWFHQYVVPWNAPAKDAVTVVVGTYIAIRDIDGVIGRDGETP